MSTASVSILASRWLDIRDYAGRLVADLSASDMVSQPVPGVVMNHAAWALAHLSIYGPLLAEIVRGRTVEDPLHHPWGRNSRPESDPAAYPPKRELLERFQAGYDDAIEALKSADAGVFNRPPPFARWRERFPTVAHMPAHFIVQHTSLHLGQVSAWRRAGGRPAV